MLPRKILAFVALAVGLAALFVRLGFWQLDRRTERREQNAAIGARLEMPPMRFDSLVTAGDGDTSTYTNRRTTVIGLPDTANEFVVTGRSRNGSPGVHIFTPLKVDGLGRAVLVNRGWVYAPDAATVDLARWREQRGAFTGYTARVPAPEAATIVKNRGMRPLTVHGVERLLPYGFEPLYVVAADSAGENAPVRLPPPALDEGPHLSYAIQWFAFAATAIIGAVIVTQRSRRRNAGAVSALNHG